MIVLDASVMLEILLHTPTGTGVLRRLVAKPADLHAPEVLDIEVAQVLRRYALAKSVTAARGEQALRLLAEFPLTRHAHRTLLGRVWQLRANITAYDAAYVALAEALGATLLTCDQKLTKAPGHQATIELV